MAVTRNFYLFLKKLYKWKFCWHQNEDDYGCDAINLAWIDFERLNRRLSSLRSDLQHYKSKPGGWNRRQYSSVNNQENGVFDAHAHSSYLTSQKHEKNTKKSENKRQKIFFRGYLSAHAQSQVC